MVEGSWAPSHGCVTDGAIMGVIVGDMIGISHPVVIILVTGVAVKRRILIAAGMAGVAGQDSVRAGQREPGIGMVECRRLPG